MTCSIWASLTRRNDIATKYGDKAQLLETIDALKRNDAVLLDVVVDHKMGADEKEPVGVQRVNEARSHANRRPGSSSVAWTRYTFPARAEQYSGYLGLQMLQRRRPH